MKPGITVIQYGIQAQAQGREDKDVLGGTDRHQADTKQGWVQARTEARCWEPKD